MLTNISKMYFLVYSLTYSFLPVSFCFYDVTVTLLCCQWRRRLECVLQQNGERVYIFK